MSVSKGVNYYSYVNNAGLPGPVSISFTGPKVGSTTSSANNFQANNLQIDSSNIPGPFNYTGPFTWSALLGSVTLASQTNNISSWSGNLDGGTMLDQMNSPPIFSRENNTLVCYGFFDSGSGGSGLTNQDQSWVYCTRILTTWMGELVSANPSLGKAPFYTFALPGAHDSGMNTTNTFDSILRGPQASQLLRAIVSAMPLLAPIAAVAPGMASTIMLNAAITQKDTIQNMLSIGCRYFDFRPGYMYPMITGYSGQLFHQHAVVPGMAYLDFLAQVLTWLAQNPTEIVVVSCNTQGFASTDMNASAEQLANELATARTQTGITSGQIADTDQRDLGTSYNELVASKKRLLFLNQISGETTKYDSYTDDYNTTSSGPIVQALAAMNTAGQGGRTYTVLQLQGTASGAISYNGFVTSSQTADTLMSTKGSNDIATLPWVLEHANDQLQAPQPVVLLNDFIDNATVDIAATLTLQRLQKLGR